MPYCEGPKCGEQFHATEISDGRFCSWECEENRAAEMDQNEEDYDMGYGPDVTPRLTDQRLAEFDELVRHIDA